MKAGIQLISTKNMIYEDWLLYRKSGIGASEVGAIMGLSPYKSSIEVFYEKIGESLGYSIENINMFMGKFQEDGVAELWQYWGGSEESLMYNYNNKIKVRRCQRVNAYARNPKYPWLFVSLDRKINKHDDRGEGNLEVKTISGWESDKWEAGIPPSHVVQVQTQTGVCAFEYGELATLRDGRRFEVTPFEFNKLIFENILDSTHDFYQRIEKGRELVTRRFEAQRKFNYRAVEELTAELVTIEPEPDSSQAYADFIKEKFNRTVEGEREGTIIEQNQAIKHRDTRDKIKELQEDLRLRENRLKSSMGEMQKIVFADGGFVTWKPDVNGSRRFNNKVK